MSKKYLPKTAIVDIETTGLDAFSDKIVAIGVVLGDGEESQLFLNKKTETCADSEKQILEAFWQYLEMQGIEQIVGFNIVGFDWLFLKLRSLKHGVKIPRSFVILDLRKVLNPEPNARGRLIDYLYLAGIEKNGDSINCARVPEMYETGQFDLIEKHVSSDIWTTYQLWKRLVDLDII